MDNKLDEVFKMDFIRVPRPLIRKFNLNTAIMLSEIYSEYNYWLGRDELQQGGWFFSTVDNMKNNTGLSKYEQLNACKELEAYGIIKIKQHGMPKKRYFKFNAEMFHKLYSDVQNNMSDVVKEKEVVNFGPKFSF